VTETDGTWLIKTSTTLKSMELKFKLDEEFDETTPDGREVTAKVNKKFKETEMTPFLDLGDQGGRQVGQRAERQEGRPEEHQDRQVNGNSIKIRQYVNDTFLLGSSSRTSAFKRWKSSVKTSFASKSSRGSKEFSTKTRPKKGAVNYLDHL